MIAKEKKIIAKSKLRKESFRERGKLKERVARAAIEEAMMMTEEPFK